MFQLGETRSASHRNHALFTPDTFVRTPLPGMSRATAIVHASPALGAAFTQYTAEFEPRGALGPVAAQRFVYVLEGELAVMLGRKRHTLRPGGFAYFPSGRETVTASTAARAAVIEQVYRPLAGVKLPAPIVGLEEEIDGAPLNGDGWLTVRKLLPDIPSFDFAVNTMAYQPGATLPMVEIHVMEHGLLMLEGSGIYRLDDRWYPVTAGDFIWMGAVLPAVVRRAGKDSREVPDL